MTPRCAATSNRSDAIWRPRKALVPPPTMLSGARRAAASRTRSASASAQSSEAVEVGKRDLTAVHMHGPELGAAGQGRDGLAGIEQPLGIEGGLDGGEG